MVAPLQHGVDEGNGHASPVSVRRKMCAEVHPHEGRRP
jgi:hypothetical protein